MITQSNKSCWLNFLFFPLIFIIAALSVYYPITDGDIFWHLASGRELLSRKEFIYFDPFSYTSCQLRWVNIHWLFQIIMYSIYKCCGYQGIMIVHSLLYGSTIIVLYKSIKKSVFTNVIITIVILYSMLQLQYLNPLRPGAITLLLIACYIYILERYCLKQSFWLIGILPLLQIVWVNCQGLYMIGPGITFSYALGNLINNTIKKTGTKNVTHYRIPIVLFVCSLLLIIVNVFNPNGFLVFSFASKLLSRIIPVTGNIASYRIDENIPLWTSLFNGNYHYPVVFATLFIISSVLFVCNKKKINYTHLILFLTFSALAVIAERNLIIFFCICIPVIKYNLDNKAIRSKYGEIVTLFAAAILLSQTITASFILKKYVGLAIKGNVVSPFSFPIQSSNYLKEIKSDGNLFNADRYGGYLIWNNYPDVKVFIDTRLTMRNGPFFKEYLDLLSDNSLFEKMVNQYSIDKVIIPGASHELYMPLVCYLKNSSDWKLVYTDGSETFFVKKNVITKNSSGIDENLINLKAMYHSPEIILEAQYYLQKFKEYCR